MPYRGVSDANYYFTGWRQGDGPELEYRERLFIKEPPGGARSTLGRSTVRHDYDEYTRHGGETRLTGRSEPMVRDWRRDWEEYGTDYQQPRGNLRSVGPVSTRRREDYGERELYIPRTQRTRFSDVPLEHEYNDDYEDPDEYFAHPNQPQQSVRSTAHRTWQKDWTLYERMQQPGRPGSEESDMPRRVNIRTKEDPEDYEYYLDGQKVQVHRGTTPEPPKKDDDEESDTRSVVIADGQLERDNDKEYVERVFVLIRHCSGCLGQGVSDGIKRSIYDHFPKRVVFTESRGMPGSFEVYLNGKVLFSRLQTGGYPYENDVIKAIHRVRHGKNFTQLHHGASGLCSIL